MSSSTAHALSLGNSVISVSEIALASSVEDWFGVAMRGWMDALSMPSIEIEEAATARRWPLMSLCAGIIRSYILRSSFPSPSISNPLFKLSASSNRSPPTPICYISYGTPYLFFIHPHMATPNQSSSDEAKTISETLISELPRERGWETDEDIYFLNGFWYKTWVIHGLVALQQHFKPHPDDVLLASYPKSGTTWLKALLFSIVNRATYNHDDMLHPLLNSNPHELVPSLLTYATNPRPQESLLFHTHFAYPSLPEQIRSSSCRIVYVFRDPKDVFVSFWHFFNKLRPKDSSSISLQEAFNQFSRGASPYGPYWDHVTGYYKASIQFPNKVFFVKYEDLMTEPVFHVKRLAEFVGWPFSEEEENEGLVQKITDLCSFDKLSNLEVNKNGSLLVGKLPTGRTVSVINKAFFRKGEIGDSKNHLSEEMIEILDQIRDDKFNEVGLTTFVPVVKTK
nr:flavonol sulfotransferase-like [Ipomoea batatas]